MGTIPLLIKKLILHYNGFRAFASNDNKHNRITSNNNQNSYKKFIVPENFIVIAFS